jgi:pimeloyl-ACP methyl ester carboxylesterase
LSERLRRLFSSKAGMTGAVLSVAAAGLAAGVATERYLVRRSRRGEDPYQAEPFGDLPAAKSLTVTTADGLDLHVEIVDPAASDPASVAAGDPSELTVVFVHGFCLDMGTFHFQRKAFADQYRMVFYDQPGHGRSGGNVQGDYTLDGLSESLRTVLDATAPTGRIILVGHSMGGMTIMALAERWPTPLRKRITGVAFLSTSAGAMNQVGFGMPQLFARFRGPLLPLVCTAAPMAAPVVDRARQVTTDLAWLLTRKYGFGTPNPSPALVSYVERMNSATSLNVIAKYLRTIHGHDRVPALAALRGIPVLVLCGDNDLVTPAEHSREIAKALPDARFVVVPSAGHVALLEHSDTVNDVLGDFISQAALH